MKLKGRACVVTGAARGIGLAVCRRLAREGCALTLWDIDADVLEQSKRVLETSGVPVFAHRCDITDKSEVYRLARLAAEEMGRVDVLVNNAGVLFGGNILDQPDEKWEKMIDVNLTALLYTTRAFLPGMMERDSGHIVNVSSAAGTLGVAGLAVYSATKWAVWGLTESLRHESLNAGRRGVKWSSVHPNYVAEGIFAGARLPGVGGLINPVLRNHDVVAKAIVESALKRGRHSPKRPRSVKLASLLRGLLPDGVFNRVMRLLGVNASMESWIGQGSVRSHEMGKESSVFLKNPATGEKIGPQRAHSVEDLKRAMEEARKAQPAWAAMDVKKRAALMRVLSARIASRADEISEVISRSTGKTRVDAISGEVLASAMAAAYYARIAARVHRPQRLEMGNILLFNKASTITRVPFGVIGIISPWNYPFSIPFHEVVMGLLAGNAVILKVATQTQLVGEQIAALVKACGVPDGLFHLIHLPGAVAGKAMLEAGVNKLFFTGSTAVGKELMERASRTLTPLVLELGGNDAMIVLEDANPDRAAAGALWAGLSNAGQSCAGVERLYVSQGIYDRFRDRLLHQIENLRIGPDTSFDVDVGAVTQEQQRLKVEQAVADAVAKGATVACRKAVVGKTGGIFSPILVLEEVNDSMLVMTEEVFGPVLALEKVLDDDEAVAKTNASAYGLSASVWSAHPRHARRVAERLEVGTVTINDHLMSHGMAETPWGGFKSSGFGRSHGEIGFFEMTQPRVVISDRLHRLPRNMWWYPHGKEVYEGLKSAMTFLYGRGLFMRLGSLARVIRLYMRSFTRAK